MKLIAIVLTLIIGLASFAAPSNTINLTSKNHVLLRNEVTPESMHKVALELARLVAVRGAQDYPLYLVLDSPGGSIDAGLDFITFTKTIPNLQTITIFAASMAAGIVEALPGRRNVIENGTLMFHRASGGVQGQFESGELESRLDFYKRIVRSMEVQNAVRLGLTLSDYKSKVKDELWIYGYENITQRAADSVVSVTCSEELITGKTRESFTIMIFTIEVEFSKCPLLRTGTVAAPTNPEAAKAYNEYRKTFFKVK